MSPRIVLRVNSMISVLGLAGAGIGVGIVPSLPIEIISPAFVQRPLDVADCIEILIATSRFNTSKVTQHFVELAKARRVSEKTAGPQKVISNESSNKAG